MRNEVDINVDIISWAIARAGYSLHEMAIHFPLIEQWVNGTKKPTAKQIESFSRKVHIPFGYLFLPNPPIESIPFPFFRSIDSNADRVSLNIYDTIQILLQRQDWLSEYLHDKGFEPLPFVGKYAANLDVASIVSDIRNTLGLESNWARNLNTWEDALNRLIERIEAAGIITVFNGVVGNNTSRPIEVDECRGFVMVDPYAPFMFINNADSKSAQMFTLVHELVHIWTGHSAGFDFRKLQPANDPIEQLCDKIAAEFLVPGNELTAIWQGFEFLNKYAKQFKVSEIVIARRALDLGMISKPEFFAYYEEYRKHNFDKKNKTNAGGDFYATAKKRLSITFAHHIHSAVVSGELLYRDAYKLTSLKGDTFEKFFKQHLV